MPCRSAPTVPKPRERKDQYCRGHIECEGRDVATLAFYVPSAILVFAFARLWDRWRGSAWHSAVERGMAPVAAGLFLSGGLAVLRASPGGPAVWFAAIVTTVALLRWPKM